MVDGSPNSGRQIPNTFLGAFFEEINHAGAGGLWAELVNNRGFEGGIGSGNPSSIYPWSVIGNESVISVSTDETSCFEHNKVALRMEVLCNGPKSCPPGGVGISNPGFWGMSIEKGKKYKLALHFKVKASGPFHFQVSVAGSGNAINMASLTLSSAMASDNNISEWKAFEGILESKETNHNSNLQITTTTRGILWLDQVSLMPLDTYKGHGFRMDLFKMVADLKPKFLRFPGGCYVEGLQLKNGFQWKNTIGAWEERPGHYGDVWKYWTDDGFGYFEMLQLAEDLGALPIWVFNNGMSAGSEEVDISALSPFVQDALDGIEFAKGSPSSKWGSVRASMGHPKPFDLRSVAVGNENCYQQPLHYQGKHSL
ncbi:hypothetical protein PIB30_023293 [Stylosanthes scabra]|uniref:Alpha-L-arabinofuranosidase 1 catalytic domain-containing protein n=1 Tax=Stylosanthes scabra TaxID=79078 RepID=A0ABU6Q910_9FABA|nr:hypothetical protein [Stylosanthes scabra]